MASLQGRHRFFGGFFFGFWKYGERIRIFAEMRVEENLVGRSSLSPTQNESDRETEKIFFD